MISHWGINYVENAPRKLLREEVVHPSKANELRKSTSQTEAVGQPRGIATDSEPTLEESLTEDELAGETFPRRHIGIIFYPGTADRVELSFENLGFNTLEQLRVELLEPLVLLYASYDKRETMTIAWDTHLSGTAREPVFGVPFHEVDLSGPRSSNLLLCGTVGLHIRVLGPPMTSRGKYKPKA